MTYASAVRSYAESFALFCKSRAKAPKTRREQKTTLFCARAKTAVLGGLIAAKKAHVGRPKSSLLCELD